MGDYGWFGWSAANSTSINRCKPTFPFVRHVHNISYNPLMTRESIYVASYTHSTPIPAACRIGPMIWSGPISPYHRGTRDIPTDIDEQFENLFTNMGDILDAAGATWEQIGKIEFYVADVDDLTFKKMLGKYWVTGERWDCLYTIFNLVLKTLNLPSMLLAQVLKLKKK